MYVTIHVNPAKCYEPRRLIRRCSASEIFSYINIKFRYLLICTRPRRTQVAPPLQFTFAFILEKDKCGRDEFPCDNNTICYLKTERCDGYYDCMDLDDEKGCSKYYFSKLIFCKIDCLSIQSSALLNVFKVNNQASWCHLMSVWCLYC